MFRADGGRSPRKPDRAQPSREAVSSAPMQRFAGLTTPSAPLKGGFAIFLLMSRPPLLCEEGNVPCRRITLTEQY